MNTQEGLRRIAHSITVAGESIAVLIVIYGVAVFFNTNYEYEISLISFVIAAVIIAIAHGLSWIVNGFAED